MPGTSRDRTSSNEEYLPQTTTDFTSGAVSTRFCALLSNWVEPHKLGYVVANGAGFQLPNGDVLAPQISFFSRERLKRVPRTYPELVPNLVVEIKSAFDRLTLIQEKVMGFLQIGVEVALLINPDDRTVAVYNRHQKPMITMLSDDDKLNFPELLPGWEVSVSQLWPAVLD
nr:Uma2 family endonuclease [Iningainema tapete]